MGSGQWAVGSWQLAVGSGQWQWAVGSGSWQWQWAVGSSSGGLAGKVGKFWRLGAVWEQFFKIMLRQGKVLLSLRYRIVGHRDQLAPKNHGDMRQPSVWR